VSATIDTSILDVLVKEVAVRARTHIEAVGVDTHLILELGMSSLDVLAVLAFAEEKYGVLFPDDELMTLSSIRRIEEAILAKKTVSGARAKG